MSAFSFRAPRQTLMGRGCLTGAAPLIGAMGARVLLVHGTHPMAGTFALALPGAVHPLRHSGEPDLPSLEAALVTARDVAPDVVVGFGGGSVLDMAKALAGLIPARGTPMDHLEVVGRGLPLTAPPLPFVAIPTTAGTGAEATKNAVIGVPDHGRKVSLRDDGMMAALAVVDPALTDRCPRGVTLASGLDAITQVIEPYLSCRANPLTDALCRDAIRPGMAALAALMEGEDAQARDTLCRASHFGGLALANAGLGAVHGLAGVIGGLTGAAHGAICGRLLAPVLAANRSAVAAAGLPVDRFDEVDGWISDALEQNGTAPDLLRDFADANGLPGLADLGVGPDMFGQVAAASASSSSMKGNPVPLDADALVRVLQAAG